MSKNPKDGPITVPPKPVNPVRRSRPVIGLASRHFEAALSGVGARERRAKVDKGKNKESCAPTSNDGGPAGEAAPASSSVDVLSLEASATGSGKVEPPASPKKARTRRGGRSGGGLSGGAPPVKISGILQRVDTVPPAAIEQGVSEGSADVGVISTATATTSSRSGNRGGGRRGRGGHTKDKGVVSPTVRSGD
jgi:regulator of nonsense transcripts 3